MFTNTVFLLPKSINSHFNKVLLSLGLVLLHLRNFFKYPSPGRLLYLKGDKNKFYV